ncbi:MAG: DUF362 domain-containing protein [Candidatus Methanomethylicia archaeon]
MNILRTLFPESREIFRRTAQKAEKAEKVECKPQRGNVYTINGKSIISIVRTNNRIEGILKAVEGIGGINKILNNTYERILIKPNCNSHDPFPASTHPETLKTILELLIKNGVPREKIVIGDMSGPSWLPTKKTMELNGILNVAKEYDIKVSFFEEEDWVWVKPDKATTWPNGFRIAKTVYEADRIISLPCLKTHQFGGIFTLSLKNSVGIINPADRSYMHNSPGMRELIAEINLAYTADLIILDGMKCFISGGPAHGEEAEPGLIIAGGDRVAIDSIGAAILKYYNSVGLTERKVHEQEQIRRAYEIGLGKMKIDEIELKTFNMIEDEKFRDLIDFINKELR